MIQESSMELVSGIFFKYPTKEHYLKQVSKDVDIAHTSVKNHLETLKSKGIIKEFRNKRGTRVFPIYKANLDNSQYKDWKRIYNFKSIIFSGLIPYIEDHVMPSSVVVFGSYQKGEDTEDSDIDIFIESKEQKIDLKRFERYFGRNIQLHWKSSIKVYVKELKNNIANGWVMHGYLEVI